MCDLKLSLNSLLLIEKKSQCPSFARPAQFIVEGDFLVSVELFVKQPAVLQEQARIFSLFRLHVLSECPEPCFSTAYCHLSNTSSLAREREVSIFVDNQKASLPVDVYSRTSRHPSRELKLNLFSLQSLHASHFRLHREACSWTKKHSRPVLGL